MSAQQGLSLKTRQIVWGMIAFLSVGAAIVGTFFDTPPNRHAENMAYFKNEHAREVTEQQKLAAKAARKNGQRVAQPVNQNVYPDQPAPALIQSVQVPGATTMRSSQCDEGSLDAFIQGNSSYEKKNREQLVFGTGCATFRSIDFPKEMWEEGQYYVATPGGLPEGQHYSCGNTAQKSGAYTHTDCLAFLREFNGHHIVVVVLDGTVRFR